MTRKEYCDLIRLVSLQPMGPGGRQVPEKLWVTVDGLVGYPTEYTIRAISGEFYEVAGFHDVMADSHYGGDLKKVVPYKSEMLEEKKDG